jgi:uncharacterized protein YdaU (DUF1376 family)
MRPVPRPPRIANADPADSGHRNDEASGAHRHLRIAARHRARRSLPDDDAKLADWAGLDWPTWRRIKPVVMASWTLADGRWTPKRPSRARELVGRPADSAGRNGRRGRRPFASALHAECGQTADAALSQALPSPGAAAPADLRALARPHGADAIAALAAIMDDPTAPLGARLNAAQALLDRGFGKPTRQAGDKASAEIRRDIIRRIIVVPGEQDGDTS